ncbi:hypothetical protein [Pseudodesulfovibrio sediminis]|uniref:Uncharacterized protein n=1 Tax=Pseudodesulfovibrio sediminis TaxID=2810563 RepID=A0ABN6ESR5_9BACT|nr:hypothetical protein [Pseudodesulfovibrio sediminis]BCS88091.1 hypothetical protein PSDVSF_13330 [Pseudodesulfovibrio sediminis]
MAQTVSVKEIEISRLYPGCPPDHYREYIKTVSLSDDLDRILSHIQSNTTQTLPKSKALLDGGYVVEFKIIKKSGEVETVILPGKEMPEGII